jgi:hypothetical protein
MDSPLSVRNETAVTGLARHYFGTKKNFNIVPTAEKVMATVFWDMQWVMLVDNIKEEKTVNFDAYFAAPQELQRRLKLFRPERKMQGVLLLYDNARRHN